MLSRAVADPRLIRASKQDTMNEKQMASIGTFHRGET